jgi:hypothetical protein
MSLLDKQTRFIYLVRAELNESAPEREWNAWYDEKHVPELLTVPGFRSADRFRDLQNPRRYLAAYEIDNPEVFEEQRYGEVTGWSEWQPHVRSWDRAVYEIRRTDF